MVTSMVTIATTENPPTTTPLLLLFFLVLLFHEITPSWSSASAPGGGGGGEWRLLRRSIGISAMHMQLLPGDRVVVFDRTDFGRSNLSLPSGRCRLDPSELALKTDCTAHSLLLDLPSSSLRPLTLLTDTWCSSASLLPNGTLLQTGGFNDGDRTIRSLDPISSTDPDWLELPESLSVRRWYSSNQLLPDGHVIILGGRRQFSFEFFPPSKDEGGHPHSTAFPFLRDTTDPDAENNLYPFLHLLPDGSLFVFANTRSLILDPTRNAVLRSLPPIPDSIPRNYPSSGSSVLLPLHPAQPDPRSTRAEVLVCGGAPSGSFQSAANGTGFLPAARSCGRITVTDPDPAWSMEDMPVPRVMGDMVLLPTGNVLIVNGARSGTAGWELAADPVYTPLMYSPNSPAGSRFSLLNPSPIPRLYHSSAILDTFGRVLVGGSNPHVTYDFSTNVTYPTDLSLEAFLPPYMDSALAALRPRIVSGGWGGPVGYGASFRVTFSLPSLRRGPAGAAAAPPLQVAAIAPSFQTHAVGMNQRMVVLTLEGTAAVGPFTYEAHVLAPPTPQIAPPGYYLLFLVHAAVPSQGVWVSFH